MSEAKKALSLWLVINFILFNQSVTAQDFKAEIKSELEDLQLLRNRCLAQWYDCRLLMIQEQEKTESMNMRIGFSTPLVTWGPLRHFGLTRMVLNPLGYSPGSSVFTEKSGFSLDCSFAGGGRRGCVVELLPERFGIFLWEKDSLPSKVGAFAILRPVSNLQLESIFMTIDGCRTEPYSDQWFNDRVPFPGGRLHHLGGRVNWQTPMLHIYSSLSGCGGERLMPGYFVNLDLRLQNPLFPLEILMGCCSADYFTPDGEIIDDWLRFGAELEYSRFRSAVIILTYQRNVLHGLQGHAYLPGWESLSFSAAKEFESEHEATIALESAATGKIDYNEYGEKEKCLIYETAFGFSIGNREFGCCFSGVWGEEKLPEKKLYLKSGHRSENMLLALEWRTFFAEAVSYSILLEIEAEGSSKAGSTITGSRRFYLKGGIEKLPAEEWKFLRTGSFPFDNCFLKIGWEAES